jgi:hypothetical protein
MAGHEINGNLASWEDLEHEGYDGRALLLGNGLSIQVWGDFAYGSLFEQAKRSKSGGLSDDDLRLFAAYDTENFERALSQLSAAITSAEALGENPATYYMRYETIQRALGRAILGVHIELSEVPEDARRIIKTVMLEHDVVFTTSYDLLVYWAMGYEENYGNLKDCFWGPNCSFNSKDAAVWNGTPVYHLHGAMHLVTMTGGKTRKIVRTATRNVLDQFGRQLDGDPHTRPLIVTEGSSADKRRAIEDNDYLTHANKRLRECTAPLTLFGSSLDGQDQHLIDAINENDERPVAVSIRRPSGPGAKNKIRKRQAEIRGCLHDVEEVYFFDAATHPLGDKALIKQETLWRRRLTKRVA